MNEIKFRDIENDDEFLEIKKGYDINLRISVYVVVENENGEFLMIVDGRSKRWEFPGGGIEEYENLHAAAVREVREETGYDIIIEEENPFWHSLDYIYNRRKDKFFKNFNFGFKGKLVSNVQNIQKLDFEDEIVNVKWFSKNEIKDLEVGNFHKPLISKIIH